MRFHLSNKLPGDADAVRPMRPYFEQEGTVFGSSCSLVQTLQCLDSCAVPLEPPTNTV